MFEALEKLLRFADYELHEDVAPARAELTAAREVMVLLEKVARDRHNTHSTSWTDDGGEKIWNPWDTCPDELCADVRKVIGKP